MKLITKKIEKLLNKYPYGSQDGTGKDAKVLARFFGGCGTWYVLERVDADTLFVYASLGYGFEYGEVSISELEALHIPPFNLPVERDRWINEGKDTLGELLKQYGEE